MKKAALVTGGAKRLGKTIALHLGAQGYDIALHYHLSLKEAHQTVQKLKKMRRRAILFSCDFNDDNKVKTLISKAKGKFPQLNLLVNSASIFEKSGFRAKNMRAFNQHFAVNCKAPFILTSEFARVCKQGNIINLLDTNIAKNKTSHISYILSKKSMEDCTQLAAFVLGPKIRVNGIAPGLILPPEGKGMDYLLKRAKSIPLKKKGQASNITHALDFLLGNDFITGQTIFVDGGEHLNP